MSVHGIESGADALVGRVKVAPTPPSAFRDSAGTPQPWRCTHRAMATIFELCIYEESIRDVQAAAVAAFELIDQLEQKLSYFIPDSDISRINSLAAGESTIVSIDTFACLLVARDVYLQTNGAFDPTVGCLLVDRKPWDAHQNVKRGKLPPPLGPTVRLGFNLLKLDRPTRTVTAQADGVRIDLGAIGKGFALDRAAEVLCDYGIASALLSAGQSTLLPIGLPPGQPAWPMRLRDPRDEKTIIAQIALANAALSTSSTVGDPHILNPATGQPIQSTLGAWAIAPTAAESDALSTAFMVMPEDTIRTYCQNRPAVASAIFTAQAEFVAMGQIHLAQKPRK